MAIRKHVSPDLTLEDYVQTGAFADTAGGAIGERTTVNHTLTENA